MHIYILLRAAARVCKYQLTGRIHREPHIMARCKSVEMKPCLLQTTQHPHPHPHPHAASTNTHSSESVGERRKTHGQRQRKRETRDGGRERGSLSKTQTLADVFPTLCLSSVVSDTPVCAWSYQWLSLPTGRQDTYKYQITSQPNQYLNHYHLWPV